MNFHDQVIFSIGHGSRSFNEFISLLKKYQIEYIIDVRSKPNSRFNHIFNKDILAVDLRAFGIKYVFMGEQLGGIPKNNLCYDDDGHVNYEKIKKMDFFKQGIDRIITAHSKKIKVACMCSEISPCDCHRSKLIGDYLHELGVEMQHIDKKGEIKSQKEVMDNILGTLSLELFPNEKCNLRSRNAYR